MMHRQHTISALLIAVLAVSFTSGCISNAQHAAARAEAQARLNQPQAQPDELGRRGFGMQHKLSAAQLAELRMSSVFAGADDQHITRIMHLMGSNYSWFASDPEQQASRGVLILSHGLGEAGDRSLRASVQQSEIGLPTALAFGMSMTSSQHIQFALDELVSAGAEQVIVIPVVSTHYNSLMRQWEYIFAEREDPEYTHVELITSPAQLRLVAPLDDHPLVGAIVAAHTREVSYDAPHEEVIIVGHGPVDPADNQQQLAMMENIADVVRQDRAYAAVHVATLQDDAPRDVRMANMQKIRMRIASAQAQGRKMIVVTNLLGSRIVQSSLRRGLSGMEYRFNLNGLISHENFIKWIEASAMKGFAAR